ncbi:MAG: aspartate/glutamate racemase family protein [Sneathiellaceae bacterium]
MIGCFDSGHGGLTILQALRRRLPAQRFIYLGDHANAPYGDRPSAEVVDLTRAAVDWLFRQDAMLVVLACNTATAVALRHLQQAWLPASGWAARGRNLLGIIAPTVEAATLTPWGVTTPTGPAAGRTGIVAIFATRRTVRTNVYGEEILKRCPRMQVVQQPCPGLVDAIEQGAPAERIDRLVGHHVSALLDRLDGALPAHAILGCTHYPLVEDAFRRHLPPGIGLLSQPRIVAGSLADYLARHPGYGTAVPGDSAIGEAASALHTTGACDRVAATLPALWPGMAGFRSASLA